MTIIANTFTEFDAHGVRENLSDVIYRISPTETPFVQNVGKGSVDGTFYEWQNDALAAAVTTNAQISGNDYTTFPAIVPTNRLGNYCQISAKLAIVAGRTDRVKKAGRKSELAYQLSLRAAEMKRDIEATATSNNPAVPGNDSTAPQTAGIEAFIKTNVNRGAAGASGTLSGGTQGYPNAGATDGTQRAFTETILKDVLQQTWNSGGKLKMLMVGGKQKQVVSTFTGIATLRHETGKGQAAIIGAADMYVSDFGDVTVVPNRFSRNRSAVVLDPEFVEIVYLRPFQVQELAKTGDANKRLLLADWGLKVNHEAALGVAADLV